MLVIFHQVAHSVLLVHLLVCSQNLASTTQSCDSVRICDSHRAQFPVPISHYPHCAVLQVVLSIVQSSSAPMMSLFSTSWTGITYFIKNHLRHLQCFHHHLFQLSHGSR